MFTQETHILDRIKKNTIAHLNMQLMCVKICLDEKCYVRVFEI